MTNPVESPPPPTNGLALGWARDFAIVGGVSAVLTPVLLTPSRVIGDRYLVFAGAGGIIGGFFLGLLFNRLTRPRDAAASGHLWVVAVIAPLLGGLWGAVVGLLASLGLARPALGLVTASTVFAAIAGAAQLGWLWAAYHFARAARVPTWPVVAAACLLPAVGAAFIHAMEVMLKLMHELW